MPPDLPEGGASERQRFARLKRLFHECSELQGRARSARLDEIAASDPDLFGELRALLEDEVAGRTAVERAKRLDDLAASPQGALGGEKSSALCAEDGGASEELPTEIGGYRIVRLLGEGGMGRIYEAAQSQPIRRQVAVKVLRSSLRSPEILRRFEAERQALAVMDHPNIAKVFDAGSTASGQPWFAMELVRGVPITDWAETHDLDLEQRISLMLPVCEALQHAHLKGVIHRDLKPSNILVAEETDGSARVKVIDFGIAKAIEQPLLARSMATQLGELVGTPEYMSPEQASLGAVDIDTRSDVYSIGLVLYELLVGQLPLPLEMLRTMAFDEICRRIREEDTPRPSVLLQQTSARSAAAADVGRVRPASWSRRLRSELDAVLLKALSKDRERRYESAAAFAEDLRRFLEERPVQAAAPSWTYRATKFVRRNPLVVTAGALAVASLIVGSLAASLGLLQARESAAQALDALEESRQSQRVAEETTDFLVQLFENADYEKTDVKLSVEELLRQGVERVGQLEATPDVEARLLEALGAASRSLANDEQAEELLSKALALRREAVPDAQREALLLNQLGMLYRSRTELDLAEQQHRAALARLEQADHGTSATAAATWNHLGVVLRQQQRLEEAAEAYRRSLELMRKNGEDAAEMATMEANLASVYQYQGRSAEAYDALQRSIATFEEVLEATHPNFATLHMNAGFVARYLGRIPEAWMHATRSVAVARASLPDDHPMLADSLLNLARVEAILGRFDEADAAATAGLEITLEGKGEEHTWTDLYRSTLGAIQIDAGHTETALEFLRRGTVRRTDSRGNEIRARPLYLRLRSRAERELGDLVAARRSAERSLAAAEGTHRVHDQATGRLQLALVLADVGELQRARQLFDEALKLEECAPDKPCGLDSAQRRILRAQWHARMGDAEQALRTLRFAVEADEVTASILRLPDLAVLQGTSEWSQLQDEVARRIDGFLDQLAAAGASDETALGG